jgi:hypothetical protein
VTEQENATVVVDEDVPEHDREADVVVEEVVVDGRDYRVEGNDISGYVGVDPEYMTYANETEKPLNTAQEQWDLGLLNDLEGNMDEDKKADVEEETGTKAETEEVETPVTPAPTHNAPVNIPGVLTPTVQ